MKKATAWALAAVLMIMVSLGAAETLRIGASGAAVTKLQSTLQGLHYYNGAIDGKYGFGTFSAVWFYQRDNGLKVDGVAGEATLSKLYGWVTPELIYVPSGKVRFALGATGSQVASIQSRLRTLGYFSTRVDGVYGLVTQSAVREFQKKNGLFIDGVVGTATYARLFSAYAVSSGTGGMGAVRLEMGDKGAEVGRLQQRLVQLGYGLQKVDRVFGYNTYRSVRAFQSKNGLKVDGIIGALTWDRLWSAGALGPAAPGTPPAYVPLRVQYGNRDSNVLAVQQRLQALGYYAGPLDSYYSYTIVEAVRTFQGYNRLKVDGVVGPITWERLHSYAAVPRPVKK